jgi:hypothetical protein
MLILKFCHVKQADRLLKAFKAPSTVMETPFLSSLYSALILCTHMVFSLTTASRTTLSVPHLPNPSPLHTHTHIYIHKPWDALHIFKKGLMNTHVRHFYILWSCLHFSWSHKHCYVCTLRCRNAAIPIPLSNLHNTFAFSKGDSTFHFFLSWGSYQHVHELYQTELKYWATAGFKICEK